MPTLHKKENAAAERARAILAADPKGVEEFMDRLRTDEDFCRSLYRDCPGMMAVLDKNPNLRKIFEDPDRLRTSYEVVYKSHREGADDDYDYDDDDDDDDEADDPSIRGRKEEKKSKKKREKKKKKTGIDNRKAKVVAGTLVKAKGYAFAAIAFVSPAKLGSKILSACMPSPEEALEGKIDAVCDVDDVEALIERVSAPDVAEEIDRILESDIDLAEAISSNADLCRLRDSNPVAASMMHDLETFQLMMDPENLRTCIDLNAAIEDDFLKSLDRLAQPEQGPPDVLEITDAGGSEVVHEGVVGEGGGETEPLTTGPSSPAEVGEMQSSSVAERTNRFDPSLTEGGDELIHDSVYQESLAVDEGIAEMEDVPPELEATEPEVEAEELDEFEEVGGVEEEEEEEEEDEEGNFLQEKLEEYESEEKESRAANDNSNRRSDRIQNQRGKQHQSHRGHGGADGEGKGGKLSAAGGFLGNIFGELGGVGGLAEAAGTTDMLVSAGAPEDLVSDPVGCLLDAAEEAVGPDVAATAGAAAAVAAGGHGAAKGAVSMIRDAADAASDDDDDDDNNDKEGDETKKKTKKKGGLLASVKSGASFIAGEAGGMLAEMGVTDVLGDDVGMAVLEHFEEQAEEGEEEDGDESTKVREQGNKEDNQGDDKDQAQGLSVRNIGTIHDSAKASSSGSSVLSSRRGSDNSSRPKVARRRRSSGILRADSMDEVEQKVADASSGHPATATHRGSSISLRLSVVRRRRSSQSCTDSVEEPERGCADDTSRGDCSASTTRRRSYLGSSSASVGGSGRGRRCRSEISKQSYDDIRRQVWEKRRSLGLDFCSATLDAAPSDAVKYEDDRRQIQRNRHSRCSDSSSTSFSAASASVGALSHDDIRRMVREKRRSLERSSTPMSAFVTFDFDWPSPSKMKAATATVTSHDDIRRQVREKRHSLESGRFSASMSSSDYDEPSHWKVAPAAAVSLDQKVRRHMQAVGPF